MDSDYLSVNTEKSPTVRPDSPALGTTTSTTASHTQLNRRTRTTSGAVRSVVIKAKTLLEPERRIGEAPSSMQALKSIVLSSWLNVLLVFIPVSWALHFALPESMSNKDTLVFVFAFLAIIPLAKLLSFATEELSLRVGQTLAGLLNATLGNAVELIVSIIALTKCELQIVQSSLVGSILSNLLLVLGMCFFAGGLKYSEQGFGASATQLNSSLLTISVIAVLLPAAFHFSNSNNSASDSLSSSSEGNAILSVSHGVAIILLFIYAGYLAFQLWSHTNLYNDKLAIRSTKYNKPLFEGISNKLHNRPSPATPEHEVGTYSGGPLTASPVQSPNPNVGVTFSSLAGPFESQGCESQNPSTADHTATSRQHIMDPETQQIDEDDEEPEMPSMSVPMTIILLVVVTVLVAVTAEFLVDSIDGMTNTGHITKEFVGVILLPIVGNAAEHVTAVTVSVKDKLNLSLGVAVGSSIQIALFVIPFVVTLAWIMGKPLTLLFDPYESIAMFLAVLTVNYVVQDGKSNWLEGFILMALYLILAVTFWYYPGSDPSGGLLTQCASR